MNQAIKVRNADYLDVGDNVHAKVNEWLEVNCGDNENRYFVSGECTCGKHHRIAKVICCGKEWCPVCGLKGSIAHQRRFARWMIKIKHFSKMRYFVLTIPDELREQYRYKDDLRELGRRAQGLMKKYGYSKGLRRWHWFGDRSNKYNPHLNILVEGGYLNKDKLQSMKNDWAAILGADTISMNVSYKSTPSDMVGCLYYITRATFLDYQWDIDMAIELRNFRNMVVWGRKEWDNNYAWDIERVIPSEDTDGEIDVEKIELIINGLHPVCHTLIIWDKALPYRLLELVNKTNIGAGYFILNDKSPPERLSNRTIEHLHTMRLVAYLKTKGAVLA